MKVKNITMALRAKMIWIVVLGVLLVLSFQVWKFIGMPFYKFSLRGTTYIENADKLYLLNEEAKEPFILGKTYLYSENEWRFGFGGGGARIRDRYGFGVFSNTKKELIPTKCRHIYVKKGIRTGEVYITCLTDSKSNPNEAYYKIENNKAILLAEEPL